MANIMTQTNVRNHVHRNGFDLSFRNSFTAKVGELLPVMVSEVIPGDKFDCKVNSFTRTQPVQTAAFTRLREYYDFFFVPYRLLWDKFPAAVIQTNNPTHASSLTTSAKVTDMPYFSSADTYDLFSQLFKDFTDALNTSVEASREYLATHPAEVNEVGMSRVYQTLKLMNYLGYGDWFSTFNVNLYGTALPGSNPFGTSDIALNPMPLLAYQKIYQDHFRFTQWEKSAPYTCNLDYLMSGDYNINVLDNLEATYIPGSKLYNMFDMRYCNWRKDIFTGLLPSPQFGDTAVASPISGQVSPYLTPLSSPSFDTSDHINIDFDNIEPGKPNTAGISVFALRQAEFLQKWKEITQSGSQDYREQLEKHWNVQTSRFQSDMCEWLGGAGNNLNINEVVNSNLAASSDAANIAGKGVGSASASFSRTFNEHGLVMCIYHCEPILDWSNIGLNRLNSKVSASSYAIPEFDSLGMEAVPFQDLIFSDLQSHDYLTGADANIYFLDSLLNPRLLGYAPRFIEYKTNKDIINGAFNTTLKDWVTCLTPQDIIYHYLSNVEKLYGDDAGDLVSSFGLSYESFKVFPSIVDSIFTVAADDTVDTDQLLCGAFFDFKAVRNLSTDGLPY